MTKSLTIRLTKLTPTYELLSLGWNKYQLAGAVSRGDIVRVRQGWYCAPSVDSALQAAARVGGRLTCISAARMIGLSVIAPTRLHVAVAPNASRLRSSSDRTKRLSRTSKVVVHWRDRPDSDLFARRVLDALIDMCWCESPERVIAAVDSALRLGHMRHEEWLAAVSELPRRLRRILRQVNGESESIIESLARTRLTALGIKTKVQFRVAGVGRVDLLIGERLVIELDGREFHADDDHFEIDRARDAKLSIRGFRVLRFSYNQVMHDWSVVKAAIFAAIARGDHLS